MKVMNNFNRKSIVIQAFQWTGKYEQARMPKWFTAAMNKDGAEIGAARIVGGDTIKIVAPSRIVTAYRNDYVVYGPNRELYPCSPEFFHMMHEEIE